MTTKIKYFIQNIKTDFKFLIKNFFALIGYLLVKFFKPSINKNDNFEKKILIIWGGGIGDVVKRTVIIDFLKKYLAEYKIHYLLPYNLPIPGAEKIYLFHYNKAKINPLYFFSLIKDLRKIGFSKVICLLPAWEGFLFILGLSVGADVVYSPDMVGPKRLYNFIFKLNKFFYKILMRENLNFIKTISGWDKDWRKEFLPSDVWLECFFISQIIKEIKPDLELKNYLLPIENIQTTLLLPADEQSRYMKKLEKEFGIKKDNYCIIGIGSSSFHKNWPVENFKKVAEYLYKIGIKPVLVGNKNDLN